jgi:hypothetical protein
MWMIAIIGMVTTEPRINVKNAKMNAQIDKVQAPPSWAVDEARVLRLHLQALAPVFGGAVL